MKPAPDSHLSKATFTELPGNYLTTRKAAKVLNISVRSVQQWVDSGILQGWKTAGGHRRIHHASVLEVIKAREHDHSPTQPVYTLPILVVEDDMALIKLYQVHFRNWSFATQAFFTPNGYEALVLAGEVSPALMICDLRLPGINGFQVVRALCGMERFKKLRIVVISGLPIVEINAHGGLPERVEVMAKPIDFKKLETIAQLQSSIGSSAMR